MHYTKPSIATQPLFAAARLVKNYIEPIDWALLFLGTLISRIAWSKAGAKESKSTSVLW